MTENPQSPQDEVVRIKNPSEIEVTGNEASENDTATEKEAPETPKNDSKMVVKEESIPPKRSTGSKRPVSSSSSVMRSTASATAKVGGTTIQPIKAQTSSSRKSTISVTSQTSGHTRSVNSIGGSGDERRKILASSSSRRASLTPTVSAYPPTRSETLAEKRGISTTSGRRPTNTADSASLKSSAKLNNNPTKSSSNAKIKSVISPKPSSTTAVADSKKKLSGTSGPTTTTRPSARNSISTPKEIDELKIKLTEQEAQIEALKSELIAAEKKIHEANIDVSERNRKNIEVEEIVIKNKELIDKINAEYKAEVERLKLELEKAESAEKNAHQSLKKLIEEAQQMKASEIATAAQKLKEEHEQSLCKIRDELSVSQHAQDSLNISLSEKTLEIEDLKSQILLLNQEIQVLKDKNHVELSDLENSLADKHTAALSALNSEYERKLYEKDATCEQVISELKKEHDLIVKEFQTRIEESTVALANSVEGHKQVLEDNVKRYNQEISNLKMEADKEKADKDAKIATLIEGNRELEESSRSTCKQAQEAREKLIDVKNLLEESSKELVISRDECNQARAELLVTKQMMESFEADGKSKDDLYDKTQTELELITKTLIDKKSEMALLQERHQQELQEITLAFEDQKTTLLNQNTEVREHLDSLKVEHNKLERRYDEASVTHTTEFNQIRKDYSSLKNRNSEYEIEIENLKKSHEKSLEEARNQAINASNRAHTSELDNLKATHREAISVFQEESAKNKHEAVISTEKLKNFESAFRQKLEESQNEIVRIKKELEQNQRDLAQEKMDKAVAQSELDAVLNKKPDTSEVDGLKARLEALQGQLKKDSEAATKEHLSAKAALEQLLRQKDENLSKHIKENEYLTKAIEAAERKLVEMEQRLKEAEAQLKVKDAQISEAKLLYMTHNDSNISTDSIAHHAEVTGSKNDESSSSAALASTNGLDEKLAQAKVSVQHVIQMNEELRNDSLRSLKSISDV